MDDVCISLEVLPAEEAVAGALDAAPDALVLL